MTANDLKHNLRHFHGTSTWYEHCLPGCAKITYTDGVHYLAEKAGAHWLIDLICSYQPKHGERPFQVWKLRRTGNGSEAVATMREDSNLPVRVRQEIEYTDFPLEEITLWLVNGVLMLPNEY